MCRILFVIAFHRSTEKVFTLHMKNVLWAYARSQCMHSFIHSLRAPSKSHLIENRWLPTSLSTQWCHVSINEVNPLKIIFSRRSTDARSRRSSLSAAGFCRLHPIHCGHRGQHSRWASSPINHHQNRPVRRQHINRLTITNCTRQLEL